MTQEKFDDLFVGLPVETASIEYRQTVKDRIELDIKSLRLMGQGVVQAIPSNLGPIYEAGGMISLVVTDLSRGMPPKFQQEMERAQVVFLQITQVYASTLGGGLFSTRKKIPAQSDLDAYKQALIYLMESLLRWLHEVNPNT